MRLLRWWRARPHGPAVRPNAPAPRPEPTLSADATERVPIRLRMIAPRDIYLGSVARMVVTAVNAAGHPLTDGAEVIRLACSDPGAVLPISLTFTPADHGMRWFDVTPSATGRLTVWATGLADGAVRGVLTVTVREVAAVTHFDLMTRPLANAGGPTQFLLVALDGGNNAVPGYTGTVRLTSSDRGADLPAEVTFAPADRGLKGFAVSFASAGRHRVTAADAADPSVSGSVTVSVGARLADELEVDPCPRAGIRR